MTAEIVSIAVARPSAAYGHDYGPATRFVADAADHVRIIAHAVGAGLHELVGTAATCAAVTDAIRAAAARLRGATEGLFVLAYAGHGGRVKDRSGDERDGFDEVWALDDHWLTDDVLTALLAELHADVHVVLISNCCYSSGIVDGIGDDLGERPPPPAPPPPAPPPLERWAAGSSDALPIAAMLAGEVAATNRIVIASCGDHQMMILPSASRLTAHLLDLVFPLDGPVRRRRATDYAAVEADVRGLASISQTPVVLATEPDKRRPAFVPQPLRPR